VLKISLIILILLYLLAINYIYAQNNSNDSSINNFTNLKITNDTVLFYQFEPYLLLNGTIFKDVPHDNTLSLVNFTIA
jgi:hypothetical protein